MGRLRLLVLALAASLTVVAAVQARPDRGWRTHTRAAAGFSIATPSEWLDLTSKTSVVLDQAAKTPELASLVQIARSNNVIKLMCAAPTGFPNVNVIEAVSGPVTLQALVDMNVASIKRLSFVTGAVSATRVTLPAGPAAYVTYREAPQGTVVQTLQYYLIHRGRAYILTYTTRPTATSTDRAAITRSAQSFRYLS